MTAIHDLNEVIREATTCYRKDDEMVSIKNVGNVDVYTLTGYPTADAGGEQELIDVHFLLVGFRTEKVPTAQRFLELIVAARQGEFSPMTVEELKGGPSYITLGGWLGSQDQALRFIALGKHLEMWDVITPATLGVTGAEADQMAGVGFVYCGGLKESV